MEIGEREGRGKGEEGKKRGEQNKIKNTFQVFGDCLCVRALLQHLARPLTTLPQASLTACAEPKDQPEVKLMVFSGYFLSPGGGSFSKSYIPKSLTSCFLFFFFLSLAFGIPIVCLSHYLSP